MENPKQAQSPSNKNIIIPNNKEEIVQLLNVNTNQSIELTFEGIQYLTNIQESNVKK